jgi:hypothetical protein
MTYNIGAKNMRRMIGILICILMTIPIFSITVASEMKAEFKIGSGYGVQVEMTNTGNEPLFDIIWCSIDGQYFKHRYCMSPGMSEPLQPGESLSWRMRTPWIPTKAFYQSMGLPAISHCTVNAKIYDNGGNNTIYGEKSVGALYFFGFVKILSE